MEKQRQFGFGPFRFDAQTGQLWRGTVELRLTPRAASVLHLLAERAQQIVTKQELFEQVWGGLAITDDALTSCIQEIRGALGDNARRPHLVETRYRRGYRLMVPAIRIGDASIAAAGPVVTEKLVGRAEYNDEQAYREDLESLPSNATQHTEDGSAGSAWVRTGSALALPDKPSIAVLPFQNMSGDPDQEYFVDGMVEEITTALSRIGWLFVIARNSSFTYKGRAIDVRQVARELGVRYMLEGSTRKAGDRVRIAGQLIDTATGAHIWADRFDATLGDIFELQDQVAASVAGAIEPKLRLAEMARARRKPTESLDAYDLYLRAMAQALKRTREGLGESIRLSRRALELDPGYVPAMGRIAGSRGMQLVRRWIPPSGPEVEDGIQLARQAIAVAEDAQSLASAAVGLSLLAGDNKTALAALDRAIALNPNSAPALSQRALILVHLARFDEAILSAQQAVRLSPLDPGLYPLGIALGLAHLAVGRYEEGLLWAEKSWRENGGLPAIRLILTLCGHLGRQQEADDCLRQMRETFPKPTIADLIGDLSRFLPAEILARYAEGLRKAGVPEK